MKMDYNITVSKNTNLIFCKQNVIIYNVHIQVYFRHANTRMHVHMYLIYTKSFKVLYYMNDI